MGRAENRRREEEAEEALTVASLSLSLSPSPTPVPAPGPTNPVLLCPGLLSIIAEEQLPLRETNGISLQLGWISAQNTEQRLGP